MKISNFHTHTTYCDGKNTAEEMIISAIEDGLCEIGFSVHSPMDFDCSWAIKVKRLEEYKEELLSLREKYKDKILVHIGVEMDYYSPIDTSDFDYVIGSVHYIYKNGEYLPIDESAERTRENIKKHYNNDVYAYCEDYFKLVGNIYEKTKCDIIGHFDLVTKFNEKMPIIDTSHPRYRESVKKALTKLFKTPAFFEINTGAISRGYRTTPYPENSVLDRIGNEGGKFVLSSDSHAVGTVGYMLNDMAVSLRVRGYSYKVALADVLSETRKNAN